MRILVLADVPPEAMGGAEMQSWRLAQAWARLGHEVEIAGHRVPNGVREKIRLRRLPVLKVAGRAVRGLTYFLSLSWLLTTRKRQYYDLIYCRFLGEAALSVAVLKQLRLVRAPLVAVPAAGGDQGNADLALLRALPATERLIALLNRQCDCINYIAPGIERTFQQAGLSPRLTTRIPNGIEIPAAAGSGQQVKTRELLFVGRLAHQKGLDYLLHALARIIGSSPRMHCTLIGDGPLRNELESRAKALGLTDALSFMGIQTQSVIQEKLSKAWAFVLPSRYEGMSNAALEALAHGVPCVLSRCGGLDTYLTEDTGWTFDVGDTDALERILNEVLTMSPERRRVMSKNCRTLAIQHFSMHNVSRAYLEVFDALVNRDAEAVPVKTRR